MRKASQDGGDSTSLTSILDSEHRRSIGAAGFIKSTRDSIKKKVQNYSHESDDAVVEPLLQKERKDSATQGAKFSLPKIKTEQPGDKEKINQIHKITVDAHIIANGVSVSSSSKVNVNTSHKYTPAVQTVQTQVLIDIDSKPEEKQSPLIFTTAKIHANGKPNETETMLVSVPIVSTGEPNYSIGTRNAPHTSYKFHKDINVAVQDIKAEASVSRTTESFLPNKNIIPTNPKASDVEDNVGNGVLKNNIVIGTSDNVGSKLQHKLTSLSDKKEIDLGCTTKNNKVVETGKTIILDSYLSNNKIDICPKTDPGYDKQNNSSSLAQGLTEATKIKSDSVGSVKDKPFELNAKLKNETHKVNEIKTTSAKTPLKNVSKTEPNKMLQRQKDPITEDRYDSSNKPPLISGKISTTDAKYIAVKSSVDNKLSEIKPALVKNPSIDISKSKPTLTKSIESDKNKPTKIDMEQKDKSEVKKTNTTAISSVSSSDKANSSTTSKPSASLSKDTISAKHVVDLSNKSNISSITTSRVTEPKKDGSNKDFTSSTKPSERKDVKEYK